jgi:hypothetical protein
MIKKMKNQPIITVAEFLMKVILGKTGRVWANK